MRYRELGNSGIQVSEVGFGVWTLATGWWGEVSDFLLGGAPRNALPTKAD